MQFSIIITDPASAAAQACFNAYYAELRSRLEHGFDPDRSVSAGPAELSPPNGLFLLAQTANQVLGCVGWKKLDRQRAELKRMWVSPSARGHGVAQALLAEAEAQACKAGMEELVLDTSQSLHEAIRFYTRAGFRPIAPYNNNPYADFWFAKPCTGAAPAR